MSNIWDYMKPAATRPEPTNLALADAGRTLEISWSDGTRQTLRSRTLRQSCPCAACVDEWTHQRTLLPESVPLAIAISEVRPVGNYAVQLAFTDGHATGIFTWPNLRELAG